MQKGKTFGAILLLILFIFNTFAFAAFAEELTEEEKEKIEKGKAELQTIEGQMDAKKGRLEDTRRKARTAYQELREVEKVLSAAEGELSYVQGNLSKVEGQIGENEEFLQEAEVRLGERTKAYNQRVRNIYMHGQVNYLDVLLGARDFSDFTTRFELLMRVIRNDVALIADIKKDQAYVKEQQDKLKADRIQLSRLQDEALAKKQVVASSRQQRRVVFDQAASERNQAEREYNDLMSTSNQIKDMIRRIESGGKVIGSGTGVMMWPVRGQITSPFGWRTHPIFGTRKFHSGIDIAANYGVPVVAADEGVVISSGWMGGYGYTVVIDHGGGTSTLYAHNSELWVRNGEKVAKGQTIALIGSTGYSTGPHCHFEVRRHGEVTNPLNYLP